LIWHWEGHGFEPW